MTREELQAILDAKYVHPEETIGKVVKAVNNFDCCEYLVIVFEDGTYTSSEAMPRWHEGAEHAARKIYMTDDTFSSLLEVGLITNDQINEVKAHEAKEQWRIATQREQAEFKRLKAKFEGEGK